MARRHVVGCYRALLRRAELWDEVTTGFTHRFFGLSTAQVAIPTFLGAVIGVLYSVVGWLILSMTRSAFSIWWIL